MSKIIHICKCISFNISNFVIVEKMVPRIKELERKKEKVTWQLQQVSRKPNWLLTTNYHWFPHCCWMCYYHLKLKILNKKVSCNALFTFFTLTLNFGAFECSIYACLYASRTFRKCCLFAFLCKKTKEFFENHFIMEELRFVIFSKTFW